MEFNLEDLPEDQREAAGKYIQAQVAQETKGLKGKNEELLGKITKNNEQVTALETRLNEMTEVIGDRQLEDVSRTLTALDEGKYRELMGEKKYDEAFKLRMDQAIKVEKANWEKESLPDRTRLEALENENEMLNARTREFGIAQRVDEVFSRLEDHQPSAREDVRQLALSTLKVDENHNVYVPDEQGDPKIDGKGLQITLEGWIESLRDIREHYFKPIAGASAKGGRSVGHNGFGTGITSKQGADAQTRSTFMAAARKAGKNPRSEWERLPDE